MLDVADSSMGTLVDMSEGNPKKDVSRRFKDIYKNNGSSGSEKNHEVVMEIQEEESK